MKFKTRSYYHAGFDGNDNGIVERTTLEEDNDPRAVETTTSPARIPKLTEQRLKEILLAASEAYEQQNKKFENNFKACAEETEMFDMEAWYAHWIVTNVPEFKVNPAIGFVPAGALSFYGDSPYPSINGFNTGQQAWENEEFFKVKKETTKLEKPFPVGDNEKEWRKNHKLS